MRNRYLNILYSLIVVVMLIALLYSGSIIYPEVAGKALTLCSSCVSSLLPILRISLFAISLIAVLSILVSIIKTIRFINRLKVLPNNSTILKNVEVKHFLNNKIVVFDHENPVAFCLGIFHPKIYISNQSLSIMSPREIESIILHERHHLRGFDNLVGILLLIIKQMFFFLPVIGDFINYARIRMEIKADRGVIKNLGSSDSLISALRKVIEYPLVNMATVNAFAHGQDIEIRIRSLLGIKHVESPVSKQSLLISLSVLLFVANIVVNKVEVHAQTQQDTAVCFDKGNCQDVCR